MINYKNLSKLNPFKNDGNDIIEFYAAKDIINKIEHPKHAIKFLPTWFKNLDYFDPEGLNGPRSSVGTKSKTAKACMPLIDAFSLGYTIPFPTDLHFTANHDLSSISVNEPLKHVFELIAQHNESQVGYFKDLLPYNVKHARVLKFNNPWVIKTKPGWSTLFIHPINRFNTPYYCFSGVVDTDKYFHYINFPFIWFMTDGEYHINAGEPLITCIPFERKAVKNTKLKISAHDEKMWNLIDEVSAKVKSQESYYKKMRNNGE